MSELSPRTLLGPCNRLRGSTRIVPVGVCPSTHSTDQLGSASKSCFRTASSTPRTLGLSVDLPALYRPFTADTCFAMSSAFEALGADLRRSIAP